MLLRYTPLSFYCSLVAILFACTLMPVYGQGDIDWEEECELMVRELEKRHPDLYFQADSASFNRAMTRLALRGSELGKFTMALEMQELVASLGDNHTMINYTHLVKPARILPIRCYLYEEGFVITRTPSEYKDLLGGHITRINGFPLERVLDSLSLLVSAENSSQLKNIQPRMLTWVQVLEHYGFAPDGKVSLAVKKEIGGEVEMEVRSGNDFQEVSNAAPEALPLGLQKEREFFHDSLFADQGIYFIQYNRCWSRELEKLSGSGAEALFMPSFKEFRKRVMATTKDPAIQKLVLDLRYNGGGNSLQGTRFIKKLAGTKAGKNSETFLLIGRRTQSSAVINAVDFIKTFDPVVIGEDSGGKPNHFGELSRFVLPGSNLVISCSTKFFTLVDGNPPSLQPQMQTPIRYQDYMEGVDAGFEAVRSGGVL